eukprot:1140844-Pelagomonas_calceolata.AAC.10
MAEPSPEEVDHYLQIFISELSALFERHNQTSKTQLRVLLWRSIAVQENTVAGGLNHMAPGAYSLCAFPSLSTHTMDWIQDT